MCRIGLQLSKTSVDLQSFYRRSQKRGLYAIMLFLCPSEELVVMSEVVWDNECCSDCSFVYWSICLFVCLSVCRPVFPNAVWTKTRFSQKLSNDQ